MIVQERNDKLCSTEASRLSPLRFANVLKMKNLHALQVNDC